MSNSIVAGLPLNSEEFETDDPIQKRKEARDILNVPQDALVFGMVTRIDTEKGYDLFLENFIHFLEEQLSEGKSIDELPYAVVVGGIPEKDPKLRTRAEEIRSMVERLPDDIKSHIRFSGEAQPAVQVMHGLDAYFGPSATETFHLAPKEAGLCEVPDTIAGQNHMHGIPAFLSDIAAHRETHPGESAFFFDPSTYENTVREKLGIKKMVYGFKYAFLTAMNDVSRGLYGLRNADNSKRFALEESTRTFLHELTKIRPNLQPVAENSI